MAQDSVPDSVIRLPFMAQVDTSSLAATRDDNVGSPSPLKTRPTDLDLALGQTVVENITHPFRDRGNLVIAEEQPRLFDCGKELEEAEYPNTKTKEEFCDQKRLKAIGDKLQIFLETAKKDILSENQGAQTMRSPLRNKMQVLQAPASIMIPTPGMISVSWQMLHDKQREQQQQQVQRILEFKAAYLSSTIGASSSSEPLRTSSQADQHKIEFWAGPQRQSAFTPVVFKSTRGSSLDLLLSSLPLDLSQKIMSLVPIEKLIEWCSACKEWQALILSGGLGVFGHNIKPSTRNGPIALIERYPIPHMRTYNSQLKIWQDQATTDFFKPNSESYSRVSTFGGLLCSHPPYTQSGPMTIDIYNPVTKEHKRLKVPLAQEVDAVKFLDRVSLFWGVIQDKELDSYKVIVQRNETSLQNNGGPALVINYTLMYNSVSGSWETGGTVSQAILGRLGRLIQCSTSSKGNLYFLTTGSPRVFERKRPRLIKYDSQERRCTEISTPLPMYSGAGEPIIMEHKDGIIFVTRNRVRRNKRSRNLWVFYKLQEESLNRWAKMEDNDQMPESVFDNLCGKISNVKCHGNGDLIYFYGAAEGRTRGAIHVLAHDFVKNSWIWLEDFEGDREFERLLSIQPSFIKV